MGDKFDTARSNRAWERFANDDPYTFIQTSLPDSNLSAFWESGRVIAREELLPLVRAQRVARHVALELGCGLGRLIFPLSDHFQSVVGVDIAPEMLRRARHLADENGVANADFVLISEPRELLNKYAGRVDFLFSWLVFQHIPQFETIAEYLGVIADLLTGEGLALLQFDTRPTSLPYRLKTALPDILLPRYWRRGIRRIRRTADEIAEEMRNRGLRIGGELAPASALHRFVVRKAFARSDRK